MKSRFIALLVALGPGIAPSALGGPPGVPLVTNELDSIRAAATNSLATFRQHITPSNYQVMGFNSTGEILTATNGEPLQSYTVPFKDLTNYQAGNDFNSLLQAPAQTQLRWRVFVPIMAGTNVRSSSILR